MLQYDFFILKVLLSEKQDLCPAFSVPEKPYDLGVIHPVCIHS